MDMVNNRTLTQIVYKARQASEAPSPNMGSRGAAVAAALVLDRPGWLAEMGYMRAAAIERVGPEWVALFPAAANQLRADTHA
ncbi:hypothetical protein E4K72_14240 [Oxalobacteraceae bacterium OM1]|nr:hypothetical protein E4K72_14240 [Oxalobacteraceae bacterium OM1]